MGLYERMTVLAFRPGVEVVDLTNDNMEIEEFDRLDGAANLLIERIQKLEDDRERLDGNLFEKIRREYDQKLKEAERRLKAKRKALTRKLREMEEARGGLDRRRVEIEQEIRECEVRRRIGEYDAPMFEQIKNDRTQDHAFVGRKVEVLDRNIAFYRCALAKEKDSFPCGSCGALNLIWEKRCRECGAEIESVGEGAAGEGEGAATRVSAGPPEGMRDEGMVPALERTLIRDLASIDAAIADLDEGDLADETGKPCLVRIQGPGSGERYPFEAGEIRIGKAPDNHVAIPDDKALSRRHAKIVFEGGRAILYDLGSTNGTAVNGRAVEVSPLEDKDEIAMGSSIYRFCA